ncbi:hypothetical protein, partial [Enterococcus cecorum]|uniref:hypothetical protein n=1 Tax=Enterococcus cecorum TaxID=44008 RepID=UPI001FACDBF2
LSPLLIIKNHLKKIIQWTNQVASYPCLICVRRITSLIIGVQQLDIVKFALPLEKISFHPIFSAVGKHTNFFMSDQLFHILKKSPYANSA